MPVFSHLVFFAVRGCSWLFAYAFDIKCNIAFSCLSLFVVVRRASTKCVVSCVVSFLRLED